MLPACLPARLPGWHALPARLPGWHALPARLPVCLAGMVLLTCVSCMCACMYMRACARECVCADCKLAWLTCLLDSRGMPAAV
jgi:hypothetical protein